jgi:hypothetical protein
MWVGWLSKKEDLGRLTKNGAKKMWQKISAQLK